VRATVHVIENLDVIERAVNEAVRRNLNEEALREGYELNFRYYGKNGVLGESSRRQWRQPRSAY
jgi:hypothetical protein